MALHYTEKNVPFIDISKHPSFDANDISIAINDLLSKANNGDWFVLGKGSFKSKKININLAKNFKLDIYGEVELVTDTILFDVITSTLSSTITLGRITTSVLNATTFRFQESYHLNVRVDFINGTFDKCFSFEPNSVNGAKHEGCQYNKIEFGFAKGLNSVVYFQTGSIGSKLPWVNENQFYGGRLIGGNGVRTVKGSTQTDPYNNNKFYNFGFENLTGDAVNLDFAYLNSFINPRFEPTQIQGKYYVDKNGQYNKFDSSFNVLLSRTDITSFGSVINAPLMTDDGTLITNSYTVKDFNNNHVHQGITRNSSNTVENGVYFAERTTPLFSEYLFYLYKGGKSTGYVPLNIGGYYQISNTTETITTCYRYVFVQSNTAKAVVKLGAELEKPNFYFEIGSGWNTNGFDVVDKNNVVKLSVPAAELGTWKFFWGEANGWKKYKVSSNAVT